MNETPKYWFKRRRYGWGWTPVTREGWLTVLVSLGIILGAAVVLLPEKPGTPTYLQLTTFFLVFLAILFFMIGVSYAKGPAPRWRWGKKPDDDPEQDI